MGTPSKRVFIAGATGYLGRALVAEFLRRGHHVDALSRSKAGAARLAELGAHPVLAQATEPASLAGHLDSVDLVVSALGITRQKDGLTYEQVDYQANLNLLEAAEQAGVTRFVYVSVFQGEGLAHTAMVGAKERFVGALKASPIPSLVVRPTGFYSDMEAFLTMAQGGRAWVLGGGEQRLNPIAGEDLAAGIADAVEAAWRGGPLGAHEALPIGGPEAFTMRQIAQMAFAAVGRPPRISSVPMWIVGLVEGLLPRVTPLSFHGPIQMFLAASRLPMVAPASGHHRLRDHYARRAADAASAA
jgi:uncharacterized protein YbjT (DUF2867 family)